MTEAELREKIEVILTRHINPIVWTAENTNEILTLFTEAMKGYVKLAQHQPFPSVDNNVSLDCQQAQAEMRDEMLKLGFRRVELPKE